MPKTLATTLSLIALAFSAHAEKIALVGGTLVDGLGGAPIYDSVVLVEGDRIVDVGVVGQLIP